MKNIQELHDLYLKCSSVSTDSRTVESGAMFFSLQGENFNGNKFAKDAIDNGAFLAMIDDEEFKIDDRYVLVEDVLLSLQNLAKYHRSLFNIPIVAITGSSGKTTTKELVSRVLSQKYNVVSTKGNLNTLIGGVPTTLLRINRETEIAVIEMGSNSMGEIEALCKITMPTHGIITHIKAVHIEGFRNLDGVIKEKTELYKSLFNSGGKIFVNSSEVILVEEAKKYFKSFISYQEKDSDLYCEIVEENPFIVYKTSTNLITQTHLLGEYHINNISAALCIGKEFNIEEGKINQAIASYVPSNNRSQIVYKDSNIILLDAYNANLESMQGSIKALSKIESEKKVLILGAMREMGDGSQDMHTSLGKFLKSYSEYTILLCGPDMSWAKKECNTALFFEKKSDLEDFLKIQVFQKTAFLIKGARFWKLETLVELIS